MPHSQGCLDAANRAPTYIQTYIHTHSLLKEERDANAELREQLRKAEHQILESFKESTASLNTFEQEQQRLKEDLRQFAENTASQRVQIKELETLLTAAQVAVQNAVKKNLRVMLH